MDTGANGVLFLERGNRLGEIEQKFGDLDMGEMDLREFISKVEVNVCNPSVP